MVGATALFLLVIAIFPRPVEAGFFARIFGFLGGVSLANDPPLEVNVSLPLLGSHAAAPPGIGGPVDEDISLLTTQENALVSVRNPMGTIAHSASDRILIYTVEPGDTPSAIAGRFGISLNTLLWANDVSNANHIGVGDKLVILPITGVQYEVRRGDTPEGIAKRFKGDFADIASFNGLAIGETLEAGTVIIIPDGELPLPLLPSTKIGSRPAAPPEYKGYYLRPILGGRRSRGVHGFNGVDLADSCGMAVLAAAEGSVILSRSAGWNGGYGRYVVLTHPNGTQTLYAHLTAIFAGIGQQVTQGTQIGTIGSTGNSTGCHLHFEIRGAKNPF
mgnify:FL=1